MSAARRADSRFSLLLSWTDARLRRYGFQACPVPDEFDQRTGKAELRLSSRYWRHPGGSQAKCAHLCGPRAEILNLMIYPANALRVSVFAVELILFGQQPRVAVIDLQPAGGLAHDPAWTESIARRLDTLPQTVRDQLPDGGELPEWARSHFTRSCVYSRPSQLRQMGAVSAAYRHLLGLWLTHDLPLEGSVSGQELLAEYQAHHVAFTPGRKFLHTSFGADWTERYLSQFMYSGARVGAEGPPL